MTKKRCAKLCMGLLGMSRNEANRIARNRHSFLGQWTLLQIRFIQKWNAFARRMCDEVR